MHSNFTADIDQQAAGEENSRHPEVDYSNFKTSNSTMDRKGRFKPFRFGTDNIRL